MPNFVTAKNLAYVNKFANLAPMRGEHGMLARRLSAARNKKSVLFTRYIRLIAHDSLRRPVLMGRAKTHLVRWDNEITLSESRCLWPASKSQG